MPTEREFIDLYLQASEEIKDQAEDLLEDRNEETSKGSQQLPGSAE